MECRATPAIPVFPRRYLGRRRSPGCSGNPSRTAVMPDAPPAGASSVAGGRLGAFRQAHLFLTGPAAHFIVVFGYTRLRGKLGLAPGPSEITVAYRDGEGVLRSVLANCTQLGLHRG